MSSDSDSDIEMQSALPKKNMTKKMPQSPSEELLKHDKELKKSTKDMIHDALTVLNTRKGVSIYAIKKFVSEKYNVNPDKINYYIKKSLKSEVEKGTIIQTKGIGASGSFKLAPKKKQEKPIKKKKSEKSIKKKTEKISKNENSEKPKKESKKATENTKEKKSGKTAKKKAEVKSSETAPKKEKSLKEPKAAKEKGEKKKTKEVKTPAKKRAAMMKRKSIGSIIKPPKMKPKAR